MQHEDKKRKEKNALGKITVAQLQRVFVEEMKAHRIYGASAFFDELIRRGYTCEFHKRRTIKNG